MTNLRVGFIGLGNMGGRLSRRLAAAAPPEMPASR